MLTFIYSLTLLYSSFSTTHVLHSSSFLSENRTTMGLMQRDFRTLVKRVDAMEVLSSDCNLPWETNFLVVFTTRLLEPKALRCLLNLER